VSEWRVMRRGESVGDIIRRGRRKAYLLILLGFRIWHLKDVHEALDSE
jgi:hypothetical protein